MKTLSVIIITLLFSGCAVSQKSIYPLVRIFDLNASGKVIQKNVPYFPTLIEIATPNTKYIDSVIAILQLQIDAYRAAKAERYHMHNVADLTAYNDSSYVDDATAIAAGKRKGDLYKSNGTIKYIQ